jgi:hypothetical protein
MTMMMMTVQSRSTAVGLLHPACKIIFTGYCSNDMDISTYCTIFYKYIIEISKVLPIEYRYSGSAKFGRHFFLHFFKSWHHLANLATRLPPPFQMCQLDNLPTVQFFRIMTTRHCSIRHPEQRDSLTTQFHP